MANYTYQYQRFAQPAAAFRKGDVVRTGSTSRDWWEVVAVDPMGFPCRLRAAKESPLYAQFADKEFPLDASWQTIPCVLCYRKAKKKIIGALDNSEE